MQLIADLTELTRHDTPLAGGKGANLGELTRAGVAVPPGFVITAPAYDYLLSSSGILPQITELMRPLVEDDPAALDRVAGEVQSLFDCAEMSEDLTGAITRAYLSLGGAVAVRSSATAEDLAEASFAGQQSTFLNVEGESGVVEAVRQCWASLFEPRAIHYRAQNGFDHLSVAIAVVVQRMVASERSGIMFTANPITGDPSSVVIEAVLGLGEAAVSGVVTPDMYIVDKTAGEIAERQVGTQEQQMVRKPGGTNGAANEWVPVPAALRSAQKLCDDEISKLARLGQQVEEWFGGPQDIEWAFADGSFYVVQSRPITTL